jgi:hypothetical protein
MAHKVDAAKFEVWVGEKGAIQPCEACGGTDRDLYPEVLALEPWVGVHVTMVEGQEMNLPVIASICKNCASVRFYSAVKLDQIPPQE